MSPASLQASGMRSRVALMGAALVIALAMAGWVWPSPTLHGWLIGFTSVGGVAFGSVAWLAVHGLTGGRWGEAARPSFLAASAALPWLILIGLPLLLAAKLLYPWVADPASAGPGVAAVYLQRGLVGLRSLILIGGLTVFALVARRGVLSRLGAALCLLLYAIGMNLSAFDWLLSLEPRYTSSAFGVQIIVGQLLSGLAVAIVTTEAAPDDAVWGDLAGLLFATLLGEAYLALMTFIIHWYGNLPDQAQWYLLHGARGWAWFVGIAAIVGFIGPLVALLFATVRNRPSALRIVAGFALLGVVLKTIWIVAPEDGAGSALAGLASVLAIAGLGCAGVVHRLAGAKTVWRVADGA